MLKVGDAQKECDFVDFNDAVDRQVEAHTQSLRSLLLESEKVRVRDYLLRYTDPELDRDGYGAENMILQAAGGSNKLSVDIERLRGWAEKMTAKGERIKDLEEQVKADSERMETLEEELRCSREREERMWKSSRAALQKDLELSRVARRRYEERRHQREEGQREEVALVAEGRPIKTQPE